MKVRIAALLTALAVPAHAEFSAAEALAAIDEGDDFSRLADVYIGGNFNGVSWVNTYMETQGIDPLYCPPRDRALSDREKIAMMRDAVARDDALGELPAGLVVMLTLQRAYPC